MVSRSVGNPIFVGLGTTAIMALSVGVPAALAAGTPSPTPTSTKTRPAPTPSKTKASPRPPASDPATPPGSKGPSSDPSTTPAPKPVLHINLYLPSGAVHGGDSVKGRVYVHASNGPTTHTRFRLDATGGATVSPQKDLGTVGDKNRFRDVTVTVPKSMTKGTITVTATASADRARDERDTGRITVTKKPAPKPSNTTSSGTGGSSGSSGSTGSTGSSGGTGGSGYVPPSPSAALQSPKVSLPEIPAATPSTAPTMAAAAPTNTLRSGGSPQGQELTFERLASTQIAWLAALLVAFSVLMTQLRLGRPPAARVRPKGDHRRPRGGMFQR